MRTKRFLLVTAALSTTVAGCGKDAARPEMHDAGETLPLPANPKGSFYDGGIDTTLTPPPPSATPSASPSATPSTTAATPPPPPPKKDAGPVIPRLPANPKGSHYDAGRKGGPPDLF